MEVTILLSTYNGERYLEEQLESIKGQLGVSCRILARDDGSTDGTQAVLNAYSANGELKWYSGENLGPARSYFKLIKDAPQTPYYAFCDQDDLWKAEKLKTAVAMLSDIPPEKPALYFSNTELVDDELRHIGFSQAKGAFTFGQALTRNNAAGCTMMFNRALLNAVNEYTPESFSMHDQWLYLVCLALDGSVCFDENAHILYRQHGSNVVGGSETRLAAFKRRFAQLKDGRRIRSDMAAELLKGYGGKISDDKRLLLEKIAGYETSAGAKLALMREKAIRHKDGRDIYCLAAILLGRF